MPIKRIHIVGRKNSGKTTLIVDLVQHYTTRGIRVGTIKHTHHHHELDTPGKDSHRHRQAGAVAVGILSPRLNAVFVAPDDEHDSPAQYARLDPLFTDCRLILVEGHLLVDAPKIEVWRAANETPPIALENTSIGALVSDVPLDVNIPVLPRRDVKGLADYILQLA